MGEGEATGGGDVRGGATAAPVVGICKEVKGTSALRYGGSLSPTGMAAGVSLRGGKFISQIIGFGVLGWVVGLGRQGDDSVDGQGQARC